MSHKDIDHEEIYDNINSSLLQYSEDLQPIFDEILTIDDRYIKEGIVNQGGMKKILKSKDSFTNRPVAKAILIDFEDSEKAENFLREARITAALEHPNIIPIYDIGVDEAEGPFFTMKLVGGRSLGSIIKSLSIGKVDDDYTLRDLMTIFLKICDAVAYAHSKGVVHLDLKPENIQVGDFGEVLVCDWGLSKVMDHDENISDFDSDLDPALYNDLTLDGYIKGTPGYMAPEQVDPKLGAKNQQTDIYALGGILYSLLCFKTPSEAETLEKIFEDTLAGRLPSPSERVVEGRYIPASLEAVAMKSLNTAPEDRYQQVSDIIREVNKWMEGFATDAENAGFAKSLWLLLMRHKAVSGLLLMLGVTSIFAVYKMKQSEQTALLNEKITKQNEQAALLSEKKTKDALDSYLKEKELTGQISNHAIEQLNVINGYYFERLDFRKAISFIDKTLVFRPEDEALNALKGEAHFYLQQYKRASLALNKAGEYKLKEPYKLMRELSPELESKIYMNPPDLIKLGYSFKPKYRERIFSHEIKRYNSFRKYKLSKNDPLKISLLKNHIEFCRLLMQKEVEGGSSKLNFKYSFDNDGINLDVSNNKENDISIKQFEHLPLKSLNLENTFFWRRWIFSHYFLKSVNIKNTKFRKISYNTLVRSGLKKITLTKELMKETDNRASVRKNIRFIVD